jgi:hypothetical protein
MHIRKGHAHLPENVLKARQAGTLSGKWHKLNDVFRHIVAGSVHIAFVEDFLYETANDVLIFFGTHCFHLRSLKLTPR